MGARVIRIPGVPAVRRKEELQALALIVCAVVFPLFLAFILVAADMRSDLSELKPMQSPVDQATPLVGWQDLEIPEGQSVSAEQRRWQTPRRVRMLGYMMEGEPPSQEGAPATLFVLLPEAGHILHPAHRIPDQMVEIRLTHAAPFRFRSLVWVSGTLIRTADGPKSDKAMYAMTDASVEPAAQSDVTRWFSP
jgi:hypothetical protein